MAADSFTEVSSQSWFSRLGGAFTGILIGLILFVVSFPLLFWNEGRAVKRYKTLKEGGGAVVSVAADRVEGANSGKLIHVTGKAETAATLSDSIFGVSANAIKLKRVVMMYQWEETQNKETRKKLGGGTETVTTYSYTKTWADSPISWASFGQPEGHENPGTMPYEPTTLVADTVTLGAFTLSPSLVGKISNFEALAVGGDTGLPQVIEESAMFHDGGFYIGANPASPAIGDVQVTFRVAKPTEVSVIASQVGESFEPYRAKVGGTIELLQTGIHSADAMIERAQQSNKILTWVLRVVGFVVMLLGLNMISKPLSVLADVLPFLGTIVGAGTGIIAFLIAACLSLITIAIAWIVYRPLIGIILLVAAVGLTLAIRGKLKSAKATA